MKPSRSKASILEKAIFSLQMVLGEHYMTATTITAFLFYFLFFEHNVHIFQFASANCFRINHLFQNNS